jgi:probable HAF family extracellular repeat protein
MAVALSMGLGFVTHASAEAYLIDLNTKTAIDLGDLQLVAVALNDAGQVVGYSLTAEGYVAHAFIIGPDGVGMRDLASLGDSYAQGINDAAVLTHRGSRVAIYRLSYCRQEQKLKYVNSRGYMSYRL